MINGKEGAVRQLRRGYPLKVEPAAPIRDVATFIPISATVLAKLSKHLAFLACLMILAQASDRDVIGQFGIFLVVVLAALAHGAERTLRRRLGRFPSP